MTAALALQIKLLWEASSPKEWMVHCKPQQEWESVVNIRAGFNQNRGVFLKFQGSVVTVTLPFVTISCSDVVLCGVLFRESVLASLLCGRLQDGFSSAGTFLKQASFHPQAVQVHIYHKDEF